MIYAHPSNPDLLAEHYHWTNRWSEWRARSGETLFQVLAGFAFLGFILWLSDHGWNSLLHAGAFWTQPWAALVIGMLVLIGFSVQSRRARTRLARQQSDDWLAALPLPQTFRAVANRHQVGLHTLITTLLALLLLLWARARSADAAPEFSLALAFGIAAGGLIAARSSVVGRVRHADRGLSTCGRAAVPVPDHVSGLGLLGAALEPVSARLPKTAAWVAGSFLLFPPSTPLVALFALLVFFTTLSLSIDLITHWRARYRVDLLWLASEALLPRRLFAAYLPWLVRRGLVYSLVAGCCFYAFGAPPLLAVALTLGLAAMLADALLCGFATRKLPTRFPLLLTLHGVILMATLQAFPPVLPLVWLGCGWSAWRKGQHEY